MNTLSTESSSDTIICDLHRIREEIVDSFGGDLRRLTDDARRRQEVSGKRIWRRGEMTGWKQGQAAVLDGATLNSELEARLPGKPVPPSGSGE